MVVPEPADRPTLAHQPRVSPASEEVVSALLHSLYHDWPEPIAAFDALSGEILAVNPALLRLAGRENDAGLLGTRLTDLLHAPDLPELMKAPVWDRHGYYYANLTLRRGDGSAPRVRFGFRMAEAGGRRIGLAIARALPDLPAEGDVVDLYFRMSSDLFAILDEDGVLRRFNSGAWAQVLGYSEAELSGRSVLELVHPDDIAATIEAGRRIDVPMIQDFENRYRHRDGSYRWLSWRAVRHDGLFYAVARDVTDSRQQQQEQRQADLLFRVISEQLPDGVFLLDLDDPEVPGRIIFANEAACRAHQLSEPEILGRSITELDDEATAALAPERIAQLKEGRTLHFEGSHRRRDGTSFPIEARVRMIPYEGRRVAVVVDRDITDRNEAAEALRRSENLFRSAFELSAVGMALITPEGRFARVNQAFCDLVEDDPSALLGLDFDRVVHPDDMDSMRVKLKQLADGKAASHQSELRFFRRDGRVVWGLCSCSLVRDARGEPLYFIAQVQDITQRREAEEESRRARELAESASRAKTEFLANMSHEIRTPLTAILGFTEYLLEESTQIAEPSQRLDDLRTIRDNGKLLLHLMNDLLDLAKVEAGRYDISYAACRPGEIAADVASMLRFRAEAKRLALSVEAEGPVPDLVLTDPLRIRQILMNLVSNAIKFTTKGEVRLRYRPASTHRGEPALQYEVEDTGCGMEPDVQERIFEPFFRGKTADTRDAGGSGLGLAISLRLARRLGGTIGVESTLGSGSRFVLTIPVERPADLARVGEMPGQPAPSPAHDADHRSTPRLRLRILMAEDNEATARITRRRLEMVGADVEVARNGEEVMQRWLEARNTERPFELILMDMQMPVQDGYETTRRLRDLGFRGPIIAVTAFAMPEDRQECRRVGCDAHLSKPIDWPALFELVRRLCPPEPPPGTQEAV